MNAPAKHAPSGRRGSRAARSTGQAQLGAEQLRSTAELRPHPQAALVPESYRELRRKGRKRSLQNLRQMTEVATLPPRGKTRELAAEWAGVSPRTLQDAATVHAYDAVLFEQVKAGQLAADVAARRV